MIRRRRATKTGEGTPDGHVLVSLSAHVPRNYRLAWSIGMLDHPKCVRHFVVESLVHPNEKLNGCSPRQSASPIHLVNGPLNNDMCAHFQSKWAGRIFELGTGEGARDVSRA